jgi:hypothetical protein
MDSNPVGDQLAEVLSGIRNKAPDGEERLSALLHRGIRFFLARRLGNSPDISRGVHECLLGVISVIRDGTLREPAGVVPFALTIARQYAAGTKSRSGTLAIQRLLKLMPTRL